MNGDQTLTPRRSRRKASECSSVQSEVAVLASRKRNSASICYVKLQMLAEFLAKTATLVCTLLHSNAFLRLRLGVKSTSRSTCFFLYFWTDMLVEIVVSI